MTTDQNKDIAHLRRILEQHRSNLRKQREQQSVYARSEERLALMNQIVASEDAIREAKAKLRQLGVEPEPSAIDPLEVFRSFDNHLINTYPLPIAQACAHFNDASELARRFVALDRLITHLIKYLAAIFIGQARRDKPSEYPLPDHLQWMASPTLESWTDAIHGLSQLSQQPPLREKWRLVGLLDSCTRPLLGRQELVDAIDYLTIRLDRSAIDEPSIVDFMRLLAWYCGKEWEDAAAQYPLDKIEPLMFRLQPALSVVLNELEPLRRYPLVYVERADVADSEVRLRLVKFTGLFTEDIHPPNKPPLTMPKVDAQHIKRRRLYVAGPDGIPQLDLHPFFVLYRWELYALERHGPTEFIEFRSCTRGTCFHPPAEARTYHATWWEEQPQPPPAEHVPPLLGEDENWEANVEPIPFDEPMEPVPLTWLSPEGREALEIALGEALRIGHFWLGIEFLLMGLSKQLGRAFPTALREMGIHPGEFRGILRGVVGVATDQDWRRMDVRILGAEALPHIRVVDPDTLRRSFDPGGKEPPVVTPRIMAILETAVKLSGEGRVGHNHLLLAALRHHHSLAVQFLFMQALQHGWHAQQVLARLAQLAEAKPDDLVGESPESPDAPQPHRPQQPPYLARRSPGRSVLAQFGRDLTQAAREGRTGPAEGETARRAMTQIGRILLQREANNPIILGDPGVGKTAVVEGFAWRLAGGGKGVAKQLAGRRIVELSTADLLAGTRYRGDLEERLQHLLAEVKAAHGQVIVFIDEIHSILGGSASGGLSAIADALKPALARGELPCIGATTVAEYRKHIERDAALARRFTPVWLEEPTIEEALQIVGKVATGRLAEHHGMAFAPEAIEAAVKLSARYVHDERLPGKAIKVLDQAAAGIILGDSVSGLTPDEQARWGGMVTVDVVLKVIADRTNIPLEQLSKTDRQRLLELEGRLKTRVKGQDEAIERVVRVLKRAGAGFADPRRPLGVLLFAGTTGVGKTELALALAEALFDDEDAIFRLDMSEFMEKHQVSRLIGAPPGYIRSEEEGQLTGRLRRRPYSVVLLDEMEKAHDDVQHLFLQLFDTGRLTDSHGNLADGRNAIFVMTTNLGAKEALGFVNTASYRDKLKAAIYDHFSLEFINRIDRIIYFAPLDEEALLAIFDREFAPFQARFADSGLEVEVPQHVRRQIVKHVAQLKLGARPLRRLIEDQIVSPLSDKLLAGEIKPGTRITIGQDVDLHASTSFPLADQTPAEVAEPEAGAPQSSSEGSSPSPTEGLPHLPDVATAYQEAFDKCFIALAARLREQDMAIEITASAKRFLCSPSNLELRGGRPVEQAFDDLLEAPLADKLLAGEFQAGDRVRVVLRDEKVLAFAKVGGDVR